MPVSIVSTRNSITRIKLKNNDRNINLFHKMVNTIDNQFTCRRLEIFHYFFNKLECCATKELDFVLNFLIKKGVLIKSARWVF